jgi:hypothetical protein
MISPASTRYMTEREFSNTYYDDDQGWDAHKDSF